MSRFFLTTAIDYVNSRPHLGTAYEKICADVIARYKRLCGIDTCFLMGNDEHSQNVFKKAVGGGARSAGVLRSDGAGVPPRPGSGSTSRSTISSARPQPRHRGRRDRAGPAHLRRRRHLRRRLRRLVLRRLRGVQAGEGSRRRQVPAAPDAHAAWIREKNYFFRLSKYQQPLLDHFAAHPEFLQPDVRRNEILRLLEGGLEDISVSRAGQSWGIPLPFDPSSVVYVWFDALINYASAVGLGSDRGDVRAVVAGRPARHRQGHHPVPHRHLAGHADERGAARCRGRSSATAS